MPTTCRRRADVTGWSAPDARRAARRARPRPPHRAPLPDRRLVGRDVHDRRPRRRPALRPQAHVARPGLDRPGDRRRRAARGAGWPTRPTRLATGLELALPGRGRRRRGRGHPHARPDRRAHRLGAARHGARRRRGRPRPSCSAAPGADSIRARWADGARRTPCRGARSGRGCACSRRASAAGYAAAGNPVGDRFLDGWDGVPTSRRRARRWSSSTRLDADPAPLLAALAALPARGLHGDLKLANVALLDDDAVALIDWQMTMRAPVAVELGWLLVSNSGSLPMRARRDVLDALPRDASAALPGGDDAPSATGTPRST